MGIQMLPPEFWAYIISAILTLIAAFAGFYLGKFKQKLDEIIEFLVTLREAIEDEKITKEELLKLIDEAQDIITDP